MLLRRCVHGGVILTGSDSIDVWLGHDFIPHLPHLVGTPSHIAASALTDDLRRLLKSYNYKAAYRSPFLEYLRTTWENRSERWPDVVFCVGVGDDLTRLPCHKAILRTRSEYFRRRFQGRWKGHGEIRVNPSVHPRAFQAILQVRVP